MQPLESEFTGQIRDSETGQDFFNARYFGAALGRFTSPDPMNAGADPADPQTWNGYAYVRNNPLNGTDPSGMDEWDCDEVDPFCGWFPPIPPLWPPIVYGVGGGGGGTGSSSSTAPPNQHGSTPLPPGSFPGGETLGLPPGLSIPGPFGGTSSPFIFSVGPAAGAAVPCILDPVCLGGALVVGGIGMAIMDIIHPRPMQTLGPTWHYSGPRILIQQPSIVHYGARPKVDDRVRRECEEYAHARAEKNGNPPYGSNGCRTIRVASSTVESRTCLVRAFGVSEQAEDSGPWKGASEWLTGAIRRLRMMK